MKTTWFLLFLFLASIGFAAEEIVDPAADASTTVSEGLTKDITIWQSLISVVVPIIIAFIKKLWDKIPKTVIPWLAPILGAAIDFALDYFNLGNGNGVVGLALGALGIGLRELLDQSKKAMTDKK